MTAYKLNESKNQNDDDERRYQILASRSNSRRSEAQNDNVNNSASKQVKEHTRKMRRAELTVLFV